MRKFLNKNRGFTLLEVTIVISITVVFAGMMLLNLRTIASRNQARECSRNLLMLHQSVNNYSLDNVVSYGTTVQMSDLISEDYLDSRESYVCPTHKTPYQTSFTYGVMPTCSDSIAGHECSTD